jgi:hypothetical protein
MHFSKVQVNLKEVNLKDLLNQLHSLNSEIMSTQSTELLLVYSENFSSP